MSTSPHGESPASGFGRRLLAELIGTGLLVTIVIGSGIAAQRLSTDTGLQLLENSIATALGLGVLILLLGPVSGAHFNPVVSLADTVLGARGRTGLNPRMLAGYLVAQIIGAIGGAVLANTMFATPTVLSRTDRATPATVLAEVVATAGLLLLIIGLARARRAGPVVASAVGAYIGAAYWFTSSTSFANPAITIGRMFTGTFAGRDGKSSIQLPSMTCSASPRSVEHSVTSRHSGRSRRTNERFTHPPCQRASPRRRGLAGLTRTSPGRVHRRRAAIGERLGV